jgi:hypothetical protein
MGLLPSLAMADEHASDEFVAECLWPESANATRGRSTSGWRRSPSGSRRAADRCRYLGSLLMYQDEVLVCQFSGDLVHVR